MALGKQTESAAGGGPFGMGGGTTGRYVRNRAEENAIYVTSETFPRVTADRQGLAARGLRQDRENQVGRHGHAEQARLQAVETHPRRRERRLHLDGAAEGETLDTTATNPLKSIFSYARFEDVAAKDEAKTLEESARGPRGYHRNGRGIHLHDSLCPRAGRQEGRRRRGRPAPTRTT